MNRFLKAALAAAVLLTGVSFLPGCNGANDNALNLLDKGGNKGFMVKTLVRGDRQRKYGLFVPTAYNPANKYPAIIFLHGVGEGGDDALPISASAWAVCGAAFGGFPVHRDFPPVARWQLA